MSHDIYLLPLAPVDDMNSALSMFDALDGGDADADGQPDVRLAADLILKLDPRYRVFQRDYAEIVKFERISEDEARERYDWVELNGTSADGEALAQLVFHRRHAVIHWHSGTTREELDHYIVVICGAAGLAAVAPQKSSILRFGDDGALS